MRHRVAHRKLGRTTEHRLSLLRNLAAALVLGERIRTTLAKAKELRPFAERLITLGKRDSLHARRLALRVVPRKDVVAKLFNELSPRFADREGGYTRILKLGPRRGDGAQMAFIEFVDYTFTGAKEVKTAKEKTKRATKPAKEKKAKPEPAESEVETPEKKAPKKKATKKTAKKATKKTAKKSAVKKTAGKATKKAAKKKTAKKTAKKRG